ncbi:MAG: energy transducer TonB [Candidatus Eremiobacteraeota bacterium]|nr:energy transducer TonB [Candidatus Eremiobacteraeota bacterium]
MIQVNKRYAGTFLACILSVAPLSAGAVVGDDYSKAKPDLFCPATVSRVVPIHELDMPSAEHDLGSDSDFAIVLSADQPKKIAGTLKFFSKGELFQVDFSSSLNQPAALQEADGTNPSRSFISPVIYVKFPAAVSLEAAWIDEVAVDGKPAECATLPHVYSLQVNFDKQFLGMLTNKSIREQGTAGLRARPVGKVDMRNCPEIYVDAKAVLLESPNWPVEERYERSTKGMVIAKVALDAAGHVVDVSLLKSSEYKFMNRETLVAVTKSVFSPRKFLCEPVPGFYSFRAQFDATK